MIQRHRSGEMAATRIGVQGFCALFKRSAACMGPTLLPGLLVIAGRIGPFLFMGLLVFATPAFAQNASDSAPIAAQNSGDDTPVQLTLEEAIQRGRASNPTYRQTVNNLELNEIESRNMWLQLLPQPSLNFLDTTMRWNRTTVATDNFGNPIANPESRMIQSAQSFQTASLNWELDLASFFQRRQNQIQAEQRVLAANNAEGDLSAEIRLAFLDAQEQQAATDVEEGLLEIRQSNLQITEQQFRLGMEGINRPELLGAELDVVEQENLLEQSRAELRSEILALRSLIGDASLVEFQLTPISLRIFDPSELNTEAVVAVAIDSDSRVQDQRSQLRIEESQVALDRAEWLPTLSLSAFTSRQAFSRESGEAFFEPLPDGDWDRNIGITLSFPDLGDYFQRRNDGNQTQLNIRNANESLRQTRFTVEDEVRTELLTLENQYRTIALQERRLVLAEEQVELQQELYRLGESDYLQLQNSIETLSTTRRQLLAAQYAFERARIAIERSIGADLNAPRFSTGSGD